MSMELDLRIPSVGFDLPDDAARPEPSRSAHRDLLVSDDAIVTLAQAMVAPRLPTMCKRFCGHNRQRYYCTVDPRWTRADDGAPLCDWGNAAYVWTLDQLIGEARIERRRDEDLSTTERYFAKVLHSVWFMERFKDWRFQRRIRVPAYIKAIDIDAHKIFWGLCDHDTVPNIAQRLNRGETDIARIVRQIQFELLTRNKLMALQSRQMIPLEHHAEGEDYETDTELVSPELSHDQQVLNDQVQRAYQQLTWQEQFVVDAMVVDGLGAKDVLASLLEQGIALDGSSPPETQSIQTIYYFLRKTLAKLRVLAKLNDEAAP